MRRMSRMADAAECIGAAPVKESYLDAGRVIGAALRNGAEAIHPGYGLLSENAGVRRRLRTRRAGLHRADAGADPPLRPEARGARHRRRLRRAAAARQRAAARSRSARAPRRQRIGYPVMLKSTAGGGGIGMQRCRDEAELARGLSCRRAAQPQQLQGGRPVSRALGRGGAPRRGADLRRRRAAASSRSASATARCSGAIRRSSRRRRRRACRAAVRERLRAAAVRLGEAVNYRSAGTVEFVYDVARAKRPTSSRSTRACRSSIRSPKRSPASISSNGWSAWPPAMASFARPTAASAAPTDGAPKRPCHRGPHLRRGSQQGLPTQRRHADRGGLPADARCDELGRARHRSLAVLRSAARQAHRARRHARRTPSRAWRRRSTRRASPASRPTSTTCGRSSPTTASRRRRADDGVSGRAALRAGDRSTCSRRERTRRCRTIRDGSATGRSACRRPGRWTRSPFASPTASSATPTARPALECTVQGPTLRFNRDA